MKLIRCGCILLLPFILLSACRQAVPASGSESAIPSDTPQYVALTFDDGPRADTTAALLDGLQERGVRATFFVIGQQIPGNEALLRRMASDGHQIGNHTYSHVRLASAADNTIIEELHKTEVLLSEVLGTGDFWLRPPYGMVDRSRSSLIHTPMIHWSLDPEDWKLLDADKVTAAVLDRITGGDIVLLHDFYPTSVQAALRIIDTLQERGYVFVTVAELFRIYGTTPQVGEIYTTGCETRKW